MIPPLTAVVTTSFTCSGSTHTQMITQGLTNPGGAAASAVNASWRVALTGAGRPFAAANMGVEYTLVETKVSTNIGGSLFTDINSSPIVGTSAISTVPANSAFIIAKQTGIAGRAFRGRMFAPPAAVAEGAVNAAGIINGASVTAQNALWLLAFNDMVSFGQRPALIHLSLGTWTLLTSWTLNGKVGTLKRRLRS